MHIIVFLTWRVGCILMPIKFKKNPLAGIAMHILVEANSHEWIFGGQTYLCANKFWYLVCFPDFNAQISKAHLQSDTVWYNDPIISYPFLQSNFSSKELFLNFFMQRSFHSHSCTHSDVNRSFQSSYSIRSIIFNPFNQIQNKIQKLKAIASCCKYQCR